MKRLILILGIISFVFSLTACGDVDEFGEKYDIDSTDILTALENDKTMESFTVKYIDYDVEKGTNFEVEYSIDGNLGYSTNFDVYYEKKAEYSISTMQYDQELGTGYIRHGVTYNTYQYLGAAEQYVYSKLRSSWFDAEDYEIVDGFYKYELPYIADFSAYIRVNSENYIDYFKVIRLVDGEEVLYEEHFLSGHNNTSIVLPDSEYMSPLEYAVAMIELRGFTLNSWSDSEISLSNDSFEATVNLIDSSILFAKGDESVMFEETTDIISVGHFLENEDFDDIVQLLTIQSNLEAGRYNNCLE